MRQPSASAARTPSSTAIRFKTGSAPGRPRQTGQMFVFGAAPNAVLQPQKIFERGQELRVDLEADDRLKLAHGSRF